MRGDTNNSTFHFVFLDKTERLLFDTEFLSNLDDQKGWEPEVVGPPIPRMPAISHTHRNSRVEWRRKEETTSNPESVRKTESLAIFSQI